MSDQPERAEELTRLVRDYFRGGSEFRPYAIYNQNLDWIQVLFEDCSVTEISITGIKLVLVFKNHPILTSTVVGFNIEGAKRFAEGSGVSAVGSLDLRVALQSFIDFLTNQKGFVRPFDWRETIRGLKSRVGELGLTHVDLGSR